MIDNIWSTFAKTGKIEDYLKYREKMTGTKEEAVGSRKVYESDSCYDRYGSECHANRGL